MPFARGGLQVDALGRVRRSMRHGARLCRPGLAVAVVAVFLLPGQAAEKTPVTIEDCIRMVRIQNRFNPHDRSVTFSVGGTRFASVIWSGDVQRNTNHHSLVVFEARHLSRPPQTLLTLDRSHDRYDPHSTAIAQLNFVRGDSEIAFLGRTDNSAPQVHVVNVVTKRRRVITKHPTPIRAYDISDDGTRLVFAADAPRDTEAYIALRRDGFSLLTLAPGFPRSLSQIALGQWLSPRVQFFALDAVDDQPRLLYEPPPDHNEYRPRPYVWMSPSGQHAVIYPYREQPSGAASFALVDLAAASLRDLGSVLSTHDAMAGTMRRVLWLGDDAVVVLARSRLVELSPDGTVLGTASVDTGWDLLGWDQTGQRLLFVGRDKAGASRATLAALAKRTGGWQALEPLDTDSFPLNTQYHGDTNGRLIVGVKDALMVPPELAAYDHRTGHTFTLTHLNPYLEQARLGNVETIRWTVPNRGMSLGYLVKPVDQTAWRHAPVIVLLRSPPAARNRSFVLDSLGGELSGSAVQVWANRGFMVLVVPGPSWESTVANTPEEPSLILANIESGLAVLEESGLIDRKRVGVTGWSRNGYHALYALTRAQPPFAAASIIDNVQYLLVDCAQVPAFWDDCQKNWGGLSPWGSDSHTWFERSLDRALGQIDTPLLIQAHYPGMLPAYAELLSALRSRRVPVDPYFFPGAAHNLQSPRHRLTALTAHTDWFEFWLLGREDPDPNKRSQYKRWRRLRDEWQARFKSASSAFPE